jgi:hypothetical protein
LAAIPGIRAVAIKSVTGIVGDPNATIVAGEPFLGDVAFGTIIDGALVGIKEIALRRDDAHARHQDR